MWTGAKAILMAMLLMCLVLTLLSAGPARAVSFDLGSLDLGGALVFPFGDHPTQLQGDIGIQVLTAEDVAKLDKIPVAGPLAAWIADRGRLDLLVRSAGGTFLPDSIADMTADLGASIRVYTIKGNLPVHLGFVYEHRVGGCLLLAGGAQAPFGDLLGLAPRAEPAEGWGWQVGPGAVVLVYTRALR